MVIYCKQEGMFTPYSSIHCGVSCNDNQQHLSANVSLFNQVTRLHRLCCTKLEDDN